MRFFTVAFHQDALGPGGPDAVLAAYDRHLDLLAPRLPAPVRVLARELVLHDARVRRAVLDRRGRELRLELRCGDERVGWYDLDLTYLGAIVDAVDVAALAAAARAPNGRVLFDEVDAEPGGAFLHRLLFWPYRETEVMFRALALRLLPRAEASVPEFTERFIEVTG
jgi:hypothetical protein